MLSEQLQFKKRVVIRGGKKQKGSGKCEQLREGTEQAAYETSCGSLTNRLRKQLTMTAYLGGIARRSTACKQSVQPAILENRGLKLQGPQRLSPLSN